MSYEITPRIFYAGVNDRTSTLFEALWPLPYGITYNSYLITDDKVALIDTVGTAFQKEFLLRLDEILQGRSIDYLIINHIEPDHSGEVANLIKTHPDITIIGNAKTKALLKNFYNIENNFREIKHQEEISLGTYTLRFFLCPMVHWPETMMTYEVSTRTLFSGDAFGTYATLNGAITDKDMETELYWSEQRRYYATIIGKYGMPVQMALKNISDLPIDRICPTHGPVWQQEVNKVKQLYNSYSLYETTPGVTIAFGSMYGNTTILAEKIAEELAANGIKEIELFNLSEIHHSFALSSVFRYNTVILGGPVYNNDLFPPLVTLMDAIKERGIKNKLYASFGNFSWAANPLDKLDEFGKDMDWEVLSTTIRQNSGFTESQAEESKQLAKTISGRIG